MSYARIKELREQRMQALTRARAVSDAAEGAGRDLTTEERTSYDAAIAEVDSLGARADRLEATLNIEASLRESAGRVTQAEPPAAPAGGQRSGGPDAELQMRAFRRYCLVGSEGLSHEERAAVTGSDTGGGFITVPTVVVNTLLQAVDDALPFGQAIHTERLLNADSLGAISLDADVDEGEWTSEVGLIGEGKAPEWGRREIKPNLLAKRVKLSMKLMRNSQLPVEAMLNARMAYKFALTKERAFLTADGNKKPLGLFFASDDGVPTSRDVSAGNTSSAFTYDGLIEAKYALKSHYHTNAKWLFHRHAVKALAKIADTTGQKIWQPSMQAGQPDLLLGSPIIMSEHVPSAFTASSYVGAFADLSYYWAVDSLDFGIQRLNEIYSGTNQIGFIGRLESDGQPILAEAFVRVQLAA